VTNTGTRAGSEVVQMYVRDRISSATRPIKELKAFRKIYLEAGAMTTVAFEIAPEQLAFYDIHMKNVVEPGEFEVMVGNSSRDSDLQKVILSVV
jgi:beta-glucosidase